jgi:ABC-type transporter Mla maintaining outer membrane lipid asymmetry ATPase subunit MlaF
MPILLMLIVLVRGVSGGERKRVSIAEAALGGSPLQCWDNSTRGLDSATALEFVNSLRSSAELTGATCVGAIYQASQSIYNVSQYLLSGARLLNLPRPLIKSHFSTRAGRSILVIKMLPRASSSRWVSSALNDRPRPTSSLR